MVTVLGRKTLTLMMMLAFLSCENNVTISKKTSHYDPKIHLKSVKKSEALPGGVSALLENEVNPKFPLSYYLIQEDDSKFLRTKNFNPKIMEQLSFTISNVKYYKLFVHPETDEAYSFLKNAYRYIGPDETEFVASPIAGYRTMVVWNEKYPARRPFIVKTSVDNSTIEAINSRLPAEGHITPEIASLIFKRSIKDRKEVIQGQQITDIPDLSQPNK